MDGKWEPKSMPPSDEPFSNECGPNVPGQVSSPLDLFFCLFPEDFLEHLIFQSDLYINQQKKNELLLTKDELLHFLGINILMGMKMLPSYRDYWSKNPQLNDHYINPILTFNHFSFILNHLHVNEKEPRKNPPRIIHSMINCTKYVP